MMRLRSDLLDLVEAAIDGNSISEADWDPRPLGVVMAAEGYPGTPRTGDGGRVLCVTAWATPWPQA
jgi:phosphoribosylamine---glycine ligase